MTNDHQKQDQETKEQVEEARLLAIAAIKRRGFVQQRPLDGKEFYQDRFGSVTIHDDFQCVEIWVPFDKVAALIEPPGTVTLEQVEKVLHDCLRRSTLKTGRCSG